METRNLWVSPCNILCLLLDSFAIFFGGKENHMVIVCAQCNASRGKKRLADWFASPYCLSKQINKNTVALEVRRYIRTKEAKD